MPSLRAILLLLLLPCTATAAQLPPLTLPEGVGINIHFTRGHERDLDMIAAWTVNTPHEIHLDTSFAHDPALPIAIDGMGKPLTLHREAGHIVLDLRSMPQYITLDPIAAH